MLGYPIIIDAKHGPLVKMVSPTSIVKVHIPLRISKK